MTQPVPTLVLAPGRAPAYSADAWTLTAAVVCMANVARSDAEMDVHEAAIKAGERVAISLFGRTIIFNPSAADLAAL